MPLPLDSTTLLTRRASFAPATLDRENRTVRVTVSTGADVRRRGYIERLRLPDPQTIVGLPVLNAHRQDDLGNVLGRVVAAGVDDGGLWADVKISERAAWLMTEIEAGIITQASLGYTEGPATESVDPTTRQRVRTFTPNVREISFVPIAADAGARVRSQSMADEIETQEPTRQVRRAEDRTRMKEIRSLTRSAGLDPEVADDLIDQNATVEEAKAALWDAMQTRRRSAPVIRTHAPANDDPAVILERRAEALHVRMAGGEPKPEVRQYMGESMLDMARDSLARAGVSTRNMSADEVFTRAGELNTSDFTTLVSNAMGKSALAAYQAAQSPLKRLGRQRSLSNFKTATSIRLGEMGRLEELSETGEITHTSRAENGETMALRTYARGITVSRQLLIDDDLGMLGDMMAAFGEAAAQTEADITVALVTGNPNLSDGTAVFHSSRGNIATTGLSLGDSGDMAALEDARKAMRGFTGLDGQTLINVQPKFLLVGPESEANAERLLASIYPATTDDANVFGSKLSLLLEPRITDESWFVFADPARLAAIQYGYLSSAQGVQIQRQEAWNTLGLKFRAWLDFGAGWLDWRAAYLNEGTA